MNPSEKINSPLIDSSTDIVLDENMTIERLVFLIKASKVGYIDETSKKEFAELRARQKNVAELYHLIQSINTSSGKEGDLDISTNDSLKQLISRAKELGVDLKDDKMTYTKEEKDKLLENIRLTVDELNVENDMQLQTTTRLYNERNEVLHFARGILRPLHEAKSGHARAAAGRG